MFTNPFLADPAQTMMTTTAAEFERILDRGVAGEPIRVGEYTAVPLHITTFGIGAGGGSIFGEPTGGGGGGGIIPCAVLVFGPDGVDLKVLPHQMTSLASQAVSTMVSEVSARSRSPRRVVPAPVAVPVPVGSPTA